MNTRDPNPEESELLLRVCERQQLDPVWKGNVFRLHLHEDTTWRDKCCGSNCDPCVMQFARAVDEFRALSQAQPKEPA